MCKSSITKKDWIRITTLGKGFGEHTHSDTIIGGHKTKLGHPLSMATHRGVGREPLGSLWGPGCHTGAQVVGRWQCGWCADGGAPRHGSGTCPALLHS